MPNSSETNQFIEAMSELQYYVDETESYKKEKSGEKKQKGKKVSKASDYESKDPIPRAETIKEEKTSEPEKTEESSNENQNRNDQENRENKQEEESKSEAENAAQEQENTDDSEEQEGILFPAITHFAKRVPGKHTGMPHYKEYDPAAPTVGVNAVREAIKAMQELQMLQRNHYPYLLVCIKDDGSRTQQKFRTLVQAQEQMEEEMDMYIDQIEPIDTNKVIYRDDGSGAHEYEPTPENELNPDGTFKHPSEIDGTLHILREDTKGIVYFETQNATARWDILNTDTAEIGDKPNDPEFEEFVRRAIEEANERDSEKDKAEGKKKRKLF